MSSVDTPAVCRKAASLIRECGLTKGSLIGIDDSLCFNGALLVALGGPQYERFNVFDQHELWDVMLKSTENKDAFRMIEGEAGRQLLEQTGALIDPVYFNNHFKTAAEDVIQLLERTAERIEEARD